MIEKSKTINNNLFLIILLFIISNFILVAIIWIQFKQMGVEDLFNIVRDLFTLNIALFALARTIHKTAKLQIRYHPEDYTENNNKIIFPLRIDTANAPIMVHDCSILLENIEIKNADTNEAINYISLHYDCDEKRYPIETPFNLDIEFWLSKQSETALIKCFVNVILEYTTNGRLKKSKLNLPIKFVI